MRKRRRKFLLKMRRQTKTKKGALEMPPVAGCLRSGGWKLENEIETEILS